MHALDNGEGLGRGLFAQELIEKGAFISFYRTCEHHTPGYEMRHSDTVLWGNPQPCPGQLAQMANYASPSSELCNALFVNVKNKRCHETDDSYKIALIAICRIQAGDEICADYGYDPLAAKL